MRWEIMRRKEDNVARMYVEERRWKRLIVDKEG